jgi:hypothetical protein
VLKIFAFFIANWYDRFNAIGLLGFNMVAQLVGREIKSMIKLDVGS